MVDNIRDINGLSHVNGVSHEIVCSGGIGHKFDTIFGCHKIIERLLDI